MWNKMNKLDLRGLWISAEILLDTNRLLSILGEKYNKNMFGIHVYVLGKHGLTFFVKIYSLKYE